jgi:iron complex outermembrane receptor protein
VTRRARGQDNKRTYSFLDANLVANFDLGPISNKMVVGVNVGRETSDFNRTQFFNAPSSGPQSANISILNPIHGLVAPLSAFPAVNPGTPANLNDRFTTSDASGAYISDFITFNEKLKALVGLRYAKETQDIVEKRLANVPEQKASSDDWLPMVGVTFEPTEHLSLYTTYSTSYVPVAASAQDINGRYSFSPTTAKSIEAGVKANLMDHRLSLTAAIFDIKKENVINTFTCPLGTCSQQLGAEESKGAELEVNFQPLPNWQIAGGLSDVDAKVTKSNIANQVGARLTNSSRINAHFWSRYDIEEGPLAGLGVGLGVAYNSRFYGLLPTATSTATLPLPGYTTVDLAAYYKIRDVRLTLKVTNLFDRTYYESAGSSGALAILPGQPRSVTLTARTTF